MRRFELNNYKEFTHKHRYSSTNVMPPPGQEQDAAVVYRDVSNEMVYTRYIIDKGRRPQPINLLQVRLSWRQTREARERTSGSRHDDGKEMF